VVADNFGPEIFDVNSIGESGNAHVLKRPHQKTNSLFLLRLRLSKYRYYKELRTWSDHIDMQDIPLSSPDQQGVRRCQANYAQHARCPRQAPRRDGGTRPGTGCSPAPSRPRPATPRTLSHAIRPANRARPGPRRFPGPPAGRPA
jgi:hypothetical protein